MFTLAAEQYFFNLPILSGQSTDGANLPFVPGKLFSLSFPGQRTYYYVVLVVLGGCSVVISRFRDSGVGRSIMAVRDNENAASAFMVRPAWEKIRAFSIAVALAGLGGALLAGAYANVEFSGPGSFFLVDGSLGLVAMVVIGGMGSVTAAVSGPSGSSAFPPWLPTRGTRTPDARASACWRSSSTSPVGSTRSATTCVMRSSPGPTGDSARMHRSKERGDCGGGSTGSPRSKRARPLGGRGPAGRLRWEHRRGRVSLTVARERSSG